MRSLWVTMNGLHYEKANTSCSNINFSFGGEIIFKVDILYSLAKDIEDNIIQAKDADRDRKFFCISCGSEMILRRSDARLRRPHFSHKAMVSNCTAESALHLGFKELLYKKIETALFDQKELTTSWKCSICHNEHTVNLIRKTEGVFKERSFRVCRPDISLLDQTGKLIVAIEIVVTHEPEDTVMKFYEENKVALLKFKLEKDSDIEQLDKHSLHPSSINVCINPKCYKCRRNKVKKYMYLFDGRCWNCKFPLKVASVVSMFGNYSVDSFNVEEIEFAKAHGVNIQERYSKTTRSRYLAHVCMKCNSFLGQHFIYEEYTLQALYKSVPFQSHEIGFTCECSF